MMGAFGQNLRDEITRHQQQKDVVPLIGVYDVFSASLAAQQFNALFLSGFGFAASYYGLPDIGFIAWPDMVAFASRVRTILPSHHLVIDIDDGYCDVEVACHVVSLLENAGASGVVLEDQQRPRRCGHFEGKQIMLLDDYLEKLNRVLEARRDIFVIARTDSSDPDDIVRRARAFEQAGADAILVDGVTNLELLQTLRREVKKPLVFNQIAGGKSPRVSLQKLTEAGVSVAIYSTPCLFAAQSAIETSLQNLKQNDGVLPEPDETMTILHQTKVMQCNALLTNNLNRKS